MKFKHVDDGGEFDWGLTSGDYAVFRPGYPEAFYDLLCELGVGRPDQRILDLGTGTGVLARAFAARGASVVGADTSEKQIEMARSLSEGLATEYVVGAAEGLAYPDASFDVVSAAQSWLYFDAKVMAPKVAAFLKPEGLVALTHLLWLPRQDEIARASEALVLKYTPKWTGADYSGVMSPTLAWAKDRFTFRSFHMIEEALPFTYDSWCGRIRACRGIGASLARERIAQFDAEHRELLNELVPESFTIRHQMTIHLYAKAA